MTRQISAPDSHASAGHLRALGLSTLAFAVCVSIWTIFSILGIPIQSRLSLSQTQFGLLVGAPILTGSLARFVFGIWAEQYGGRIVLSLVLFGAAITTVLLSLAGSYPVYLLAALGVGLSGGAFAGGVSYISRWYPKGERGAPLSIFAAGNVGAAATVLLLPAASAAYGWHVATLSWAAAAALMGLLFLVFARSDPGTVARRAAGRPVRKFVLHLAPLRNIQVWRFSIYYFFVFGVFIALALWLPRYAMGVYGLDLTQAGAVAAVFIIPGSLFRAYGKVLVDRHGPRRVIYWTFLVAICCIFLLSYPPTDYVVSGERGPIAFHLALSLPAFIAIIFVLGFFLSLGSAAVYRHIPVYYPEHMGAVGGLVGMVGGFGGLVLPLLFGVLNDLTGIWQTCFMLLFVLMVVGLVWMHLSILQMERQSAGTLLERLPALPEMEELHGPEQQQQLAPHLVVDWRPDDPAFWQSTGRKVAQRNLWISIPALLLSFAVWMVWSVVVAKLPAVGFKLGTDQLFWLAALPGLSGATLRIFYSFMVPIFGGRLWTTLTTWSLLIPAVGIGYAVQNPHTPYAVMLLLALLCGFGGGNFASSMANISFFFPRAEKGNALALNAGLGNLGVSVVQFVAPVVITSGIFGWFGGGPQTVVSGGTSQLWLQNAGFIWVPFIALSAFAAWFGMNDLSTAKASFAEQSVIFQRKHNWIMCWLYTGTFGSFIGYSAGFPLLIKTQFPHVNALEFAFLGPLVGALSRSLTGWIADRWGGGRVTFWTFAVMTAAVAGVLYFLGVKDEPGAFWGFFAMFMVLFLATGVGNASTFQMVPVIMRQELKRLMPDAAAELRTRQAEKESAAIIGFTSAIAAYGAFFIPKAYGSSIALTGGPQAALWTFLVFYVLCVVVTWVFYTRRGGLLFDIEHRTPTGDNHSAGRVRKERR